MADGVTDDTAAINASIALASPGDQESPKLKSPTGQHFCAGTIALLEGAQRYAAVEIVPGNTNPGNIALDLTTLNGAV